jgi:pyruvate dehydrogenase E2 component (dihydrolipoamide acetyltransferase)
VREAAGAAPVAQIAADVADEVTEVKLSNMRKIIGDRMVQSLREAAQLTLHGSADASGLLAYRARVKKSGESLGLANITITDLVVFAVTRLLPRFPEINALYKDGSVFQHKHAHCALAVDTPRGLMVPVIRYADRLSLNDLAIEAKQLAAQCIEGSINPDFLSGGTLTISNLGSFGVEYFTPVLNPPQVALLGVNAITSRPVAGADGAVVMKPHIGLSLTIDHRAVDGAPGARFLKAVVEALENIQLTLSL